MIEVVRRYSFSNDGFFSGEPVEIVRAYLRGERSLTDPAVEDALDAFIAEEAIEPQVERSLSDALAWRWQDGPLPVPVDSIDDPEVLRQIIREGEAASAWLAAREDGSYREFAAVLGIEPTQRPVESPEDALFRDFYDR